jgi:TP901 family phage tail tape measure protein
MSRIDLQIVATGNFAAVEGQLARLKSQIAAINSMGIVGGPAQLKNIQSYSTAFANALSASGMFQSRMVNLTSETEKFGRSLERGNLRLGQYFRAGAEYARRQQGQVRSLAREQVRMMNSTAMALGDGKAMVVTPRGIDEAINKQKILNQEHRIFRQVVQGGATQLINWGKNTQWAGRQLTVGLTVPLMIFGAVAGKMFMDADKQLTRMAKVYGDATTGMINEQELDAIRGKTLALAQEISRTMGVSAAETIGIAADIAATGREGNELLSSTKEAMRLSVLGEVDRQEAMKATLAIQSVFKQDTDGLTESINLLNAVENQTSTTLNDLVTGIIKAGPVVKGLGGNIADLASMMVAMREGGIPASEAANAIKSSLASLINPTKQTTDLLAGFGINLREIVDKNAGNVIGTLVELQGALDGIDQLSRQRAIEQMFGKFQFSRINALLNNLNRAGSQTEQVLKIAGMSATQLAQTAQTEMDRLTESASMRFTRAVEGLKSSMIPIGETFIELGSKIINFAESVIGAFNDLPEGLKSFIKIVGGITAIAGPIIMITGVFGNFFGYIIKTVGALMSLRRGARGVFEFYTADSIAAQSATDLLSKGMFNQTEATNVLRSALDTLNAELQQVARNMNVVANASSAAMARQGAATASAAAAVAGSSAAALAARNSSVLGFLSAGGKSKSSSFIGPEFSHLHPRSFLAPGAQYAQTSGVLLNRSNPAQAAAAAYQQEMGNKFAPRNFYDPSQGSRIAQLEQMMYGAGKATRTNIASINTLRTTGAEGTAAAARLYPSRSEYNAYVAKYWAALERLDQMGKAQVDRMTAAINKEMAKGNVAGAEAILMSALDVNGKQFKRLVDEQAKKVTAVNGTMGEVIAKVGTTTAGLEARLRAAGMTGFGTGVPKSGSDAGNMMRFVSAGMGGGMISDDKLVDKRSARYMDSLGKQTQLTDQRNVWIQRLNEREQKLAAAIAQHGEKSKQASAALGQVTRAKKELAIVMGKLKANTEELALAEKGLLKPKMNELAQSMGLTSKEMDAYRGALMTGKVGQLKQMESAKLLEIAGQKYAFQLTAAGNILNAVNLTTKKLVAKEEALALYRSRQLAGITEEISTMKMGFFAKRRLNAEIQNLILKHKETAASFELVRQANGKYAVSVKNAADKVLATTGQYAMGQGAKSQRFAMGAGMAAGMGMMFMPMDGSGGAAAKTAGGALMGASMGSMFGVPGLAMGAALGAAIPILQAYQKEQQAVNDRLISYGEALNGSSLVLDKFASEIGKLKPSEKLTAALGNISMPEKVVEAGKSILDTEAGQQLREMSRNLGGEQLRVALSNQLKQLTLMQIFTPEEAKAVAQTLAIELSNPELGRSLVQGINSILDSEGNLIKDNISSLFMDTIPDIEIPDFGERQVENYLNNQQTFLGNAKDMGEALLGWWRGDLADEILNDVFGLGQASSIEVKQAATRFAQENIGTLASSLDKLRESQALVVNDFMSGNIAYEEYSKRMQDIQEQNIKAADAILKMKEAGADVGAMLKDIADKSGRGEDFINIENITKGMFDTIGVGERFLTQVQLAAAYGDITLGEVQNVADLITDEDTRKNLEIVFNVKGAEDNATEIIKLLGMGLDAEFIKTIAIDSVEIGKPLSDIYASLSAIAKLPPQVQKSVIADIQSDPIKMQNFISDFEYVQSLPDTKKGLYAEIQGNDDLVELRDNWDQFIALPKEERKTAILTTIITGSYDFGGPPVIPSPVASDEITMPDVSSMIPSSSGGGGGGSGSAGDSAIDKKIKQQDRIIKQIQKEREERQRLLDLEKQTLDFALKKQGLENQIARAKAEGRLADAALLQAQLDIENKAKDDDEKERRLQEEEDKRIARAERRKKELEKEKKKSSGGGGGGGGGGADQEAARKIEQRLMFLNDELQAALQGNVKILDDINDMGADAFWNYGPIKRYIKEAVKAGVPLKTVRAELEKIFDFIVGEGFKEVPIYKQIADDLKDVGVAGESLNKILPNVFAILQDPKLDAEEALAAVVKQFESIGMTADEAKTRAEKFFNMKSSVASSMYQNLDKFNDKFDEIKNRFSDKNGRTIITEFTKGIRDGLSRSQILDSISKAIYDSVYTEGIASKMGERAAADSAQRTADSVKGIMNKEFDDYFKEVDIRGKWDGIVNGQEIPSVIRHLFDKNGKFTGTADTAATIALESKVTATVDLANGSSAGKPLYASITNWPRTPGSNNGGYSYPSSVTNSATGGYISGPGGPMSDIIPAMLSNGEYVIRASSVDKFGTGFFDALNKGMLPEFGRGGSSKYPSMVRNMGMGGAVYYNKGGFVNESSSNTEYNIEVNVSSTNASPDDIATEVIRAIERRQRMKGSSITI